jgi:hypothetical protein
MNITNDSARFDELQMKLLHWLAFSIQDSLRRAGVGEDKIADLTEDLTFQTACVFDNSTNMKHEGFPLVPILTFAVDEKRENLVGVEGGSWMHEYAIGVAETICAGEWSPQREEKA